MRQIPFRLTAIVLAGTFAFSPGTLLAKPNTFPGENAQNLPKSVVEARAERKERAKKLRQERRERRLERNKQRKEQKQ